MKTLFLVRHGKSSYSLTLDDKERPLTERGINDINHIAVRVETILPKNFTIWSSTAKRAHDTALTFAKSIAFPIEEIIFKKELYCFTVFELEKIIKSCPNNCNNLILFGHNEAISIFVNKFGNKLIDHVPTAGLVVLEFETNDWSKIEKGKTLNTLFPKNLN